MTVDDSTMDYRDLLFEVRSKINSSRSMAMMLIMLLLVFDYSMSVTRSFWEPTVFSQVITLYLLMAVILLIDLLLLSSRKSLFNILLMGYRHRAVSLQAMKNWSSRLYSVARALLSFFVGFAVLLVILTTAGWFGLSTHQNILILSWLLSLLVFAGIVIFSRLIQALSHRKDFHERGEERSGRKKKSFKDLIIPFLASLTTYLLRYFLDAIIELIVPSISSLKDKSNQFGTVFLFLTSTLTFLTILTVAWGMQSLAMVLRERRERRWRLATIQSSNYMKQLLTRRWGNSWLVGGSSFIGGLFLILMTVMANSAVGQPASFSDILPWMLSDVLPNLFVPSIIPLPALETLTMTSLALFVLALLLITLRPTHVADEVRGISVSRLLNLTCFGGTIYTFFLLQGYSLSSLVEHVEPMNSFFMVTGIGFALFMAFSPYFFSLIHTNRDTSLILRQHYLRDLSRFTEQYKGIFFDQYSLTKAMLFQALLVLVAALVIMVGENSSIMYGLLNVISMGFQNNSNALENLLKLYLSGPFMLLRVLLHGYMLLVLFFMRFEVPRTI